MGLINCLSEIGLSSKGVQEKIDALIKAGKSPQEAEARVKIEFIQKEFESANLALNALKKELKLPLSKPVKIAVDFNAIAKEYENAIKDIEAPTENATPVVPETKVEEKPKPQAVEKTTGIKEPSISEAFRAIEEAKRSKKTQKGKIDAGEQAVETLGDIGKKAIFIDNNFKEIINKIKDLKDEKGEPLIKINCS